jgi:hypothetical protein
VILFVLQLFIVITAAFTVLCIVYIVYEMIRRGVAALIARRRRSERL